MGCYRLEVGDTVEGVGKAAATNMRYGSEIYDLH